ncbi:MAG: hypothetical protein LBS16_01235 [Prevotellaceae bacterium]|nr:hypothetical protein [Prevotellaceae bacterium]
MKKILLFFSISVLISACNNSYCDEPPKSVLHKSYIESFLECGKVANRAARVLITVGTEIDSVTGIIASNKNYVSDYNPYSPAYDIGKEKIGLEITVVPKRDDGSLYRDINLSYIEYSPNYQFYARQKHVYDSCIAVIGDTAFNKLTYSATIQVVAIITPVSEIIITCDADFSADFPKGSNLSSLFTVFFDDPYSTIKNNYQAVEGSYRSQAALECDYPQSIIKTNLAEAHFADRPFIGHEWECFLDVAPDYTGVYRFAVKIILVDGTELTGVAPIVIKLKGNLD